jgi:hypothetical protein
MDIQTIHKSEFWKIYKHSGTFFIGKDSIVIRTGKLEQGYLLFIICIPRYLSLRCGIACAANLFGSVFLLFCCSATVRLFAGFGAVTRLVRLNPSGKSVPRAGGWARSSED